MNWCIKKLCPGLVLTVSLLRVTLEAQVQDSVVWPLNVDQNAIATGELVALPQSLSNMQVKYENGVQRSSPSGVAGSWPAEATENSSRFLQFAVTPGQGTRFTVQSLSMYLYVNSGSNMRANVYYSMDPAFVSRTQVGSTYVLSSTVPTAPNVTAILDMAVTYPDTFYVRIYPWYTTATTGKYVIVKQVTIVGVMTPAVCLTPSPAALSGFIQTAPAQPSDTQIYSISGSNLADTVFIYPPPCFELAGMGDSTWVGSGEVLRIPVQAGAIVGQPYPLAVRLHADSVGEYTGAIRHSSSGAADALVTVSGVLLAPEPTLAGSIAVEAVSGSAASIISRGGNGSRRLVALSEGSTLTWLPSDSRPVSGVRADFSAAADQGDGTRVVYDGPDSVITVCGLARHTTYSVAVFEYNVGPGNTQNYLTREFATAMFTTLATPLLAVKSAALPFGVVLLGERQVQNYRLTGETLALSDTIRITAPAGYTLALAPAETFNPELRLTYSGSSIDTSVYVSFQPAEVGDYTGAITHTGGGAEPVALTVTGKGVLTLVDNSVPLGFATLGGGTTGGQGGDTVIVSTAQELYDLMHARENKSTAPVVVIINGTLSGYPDKIPIKRTANISIIGKGQHSGLLGFGMKINECANIIVRNLTFADSHVAEKDALEIDNCHNVWIDHCSFTDDPADDPSGNTHDGLLDIKNGSYNITVSYNHFWNHRKTCLLGHTRDQVTDTIMTVTYYGNWFDGTYSRHPRIRYARAHIINNLYTNVGSYGVGVTCSAQVLVEGNYFEKAPIPILISQINDQDGTLSGDPAGYVKALANFTVNSGAIVEHLAGYNFDPHDYYDYDLLPAEQVKVIVQQHAGAGVLDSTDVMVRPPAEQLPRQSALTQNYPNPFNPRTNIIVTLPQTGPVRLLVYDLLGRLVTTLSDAELPAGTHVFIFDGSQLSSGIYFYQLQAGAYRETRKMLLLR